MSRVIQFTDFKSLNIRLIDQTFEFVGDSNDIETEIPAATTIPIKSMLTIGSIRFELPDIGFVEERGIAPGAIFPGPKAIAQTKFKITALEDNTHIHCVHPLQDGGKIIYIETDFSAGNSVDVPKGNLAFVFGNNYMINSDTYSNFHIFAVQNSNITINLINNAKVVIFKSVTE